MKSKGPALWITLIYFLRNHLLRFFFKAISVEPKKLYGSDIWASHLKFLWIRGLRGLPQRTAGHPQTPTPRGALSRGLTAWAGRLRLPLSPPPSFALLLLPFSSSCGCCCCQTSPFQTHRAALPCALLRCQGRRAAWPPAGRSPKPKSQGARCTRGVWWGDPRTVWVCANRWRRAVEVRVWEWNLSAYATTWVTSVRMGRVWALTTNPENLAGDRGL